MNLRDYTYLVAVADQRHFGKAAEQCHVSQPALSMQLQKLEETLGVQLLERGHKQVRVTPAGDAVVKRARQLLLMAEEIKQTAALFHDPLSGDFRLGAFPTLAPYYLPKIVPGLHAALPKLNLLLVEEKTQRLVELLKSGELDAAFIALPIDDKELHAAPLFEDSFYLAVRKSHPFAKKKSITARDLRDERLLLLEEGHCLRTHALEACSVIGRNEYKEFRATSLETLLQMVGMGMGVTLVPHTALRTDKHLAYIPFANPAPGRTIGLVWRKHSARMAGAEKIHAICATLSVDK